MDITVNYPELEEVYNYPSKNIDPSSINFIITHGDCFDGFMSYVIARNYIQQYRDVIEYDKNNVIDDTDDTIDNNVCYVFHAYHSISNIVIETLIENIKGRNVLICDFSFKANIFNRMIEVTENILVLDHHKTALENFQDIDSKYYVMDMNHSGAFITYTYFNGFLNIPYAVLYIEDTDIWKKALPMTEEFSSYMSTLEMTYDNYTNLLLNSNVISSFEIGKVLLKQKEKIVDKHVRKMNILFMQISQKYYFVANMQTDSMYVSDIGNKCMRIYDKINFACLLNKSIKYCSTKISLRSLDHRTDCSKIARLNGGGGHRNASGCASKSLIDNIPGRVLNINEAYSILDNVYDVKSSVLEPKIFKFYDVDEHNDNDVYVIINTPIMKTSFVRYLTQEIDDNNKCEGEYIIEKLSSKNVNVKGAIAWHKSGDKYYYKMAKLFEHNQFEPTELFNSNCEIEYIKNDIISFSSDSFIC